MGRRPHFAELTCPSPLGGKTVAASVRLCSSTAGLHDMDMSSSRDAIGEFSLTIDRAQESEADPAPCSMHRCAKMWRR